MPLARILITYVDRYGWPAPNNHVTIALLLAESDALHIMHQLREMVGLAAAHEKRVADMFQ